MCHLVSPWWRPTVLGLGLVLTLLGLFVPPASAAVGDHYGTIYFQDGFALQGFVRREGATEFDSVAHDVFFVPKGFFVVEDGVRRIVFSPKQVRTVDKKPTPIEESFALPGRPQVFGSAPPRFPLFLGVEETTPWNDRWDRTITLRTEGSPLTLPQHIDRLTPHSVTVRSIARYRWSCQYLTSELGPETVQRLLAAHPEFTKPRDKTPKGVAARRLRLASFYIQAGWLDLAESELNQLARDVPESKDRVASFRATLGQIQARERYEEIKRLHAAGQYETVRKRLDDFQREHKKTASEQVLSAYLELKSQYASTKHRLDETKRLLELARKWAAGSDRELLTAAESIVSELRADNVDRLDTFLGQARQTERQQKNGLKPTTPPEGLLSLAVSGWLLGNESAEAKPENALRLWRAREMVLTYLQSHQAGDRERILDSYLRRESKAPIAFDEVRKLVLTLPPPEPATELKPGTHEMTIGTGGRQIKYQLHLPPEYHHGRAYPVLIALHHAGEKPSDMIDRLGEAAADNGYLLVAPDWKPGPNGYSWSEKEHGLIEKLLRDLRRRFQVDSDRVFLLGFGDGGLMAWDIGLAHPSWFAGVLPVGAAPYLFADRYWRNGQYLPFYVVHGSKTAEASSKRLREEFEPWAMRGYPSMWISYMGRGMEWFPGEVPSMFDWMRPKRRAFPMSQLGSSGGGTGLGSEFCSLRECDNQFYWVGIGDIHPRRLTTADNWKGDKPATVCASVNQESNIITVYADGVGQVTVWLALNARGASVIDFEKPLTVRAGVIGNLRVPCNNRKVTPSLATLLEDLYDRGDRQNVVAAKLTVSLR
jgi:predicted esterase